MAPSSHKVTRDNAKRKLQAGGIAVGFGLHHLRTIAAPALVAATDHDYMSIDMEHGAFTL